MRYYIFLFGFILLALSRNQVIAQENMQVKIVLNNGVKIKGASVKSFNENSLEVNINASDPIVVRYNLIKTITFKGYGTLDSDIEEHLKNPPSLNLKSFYHEFRGSLLFGEESLNGAIHTINGYQFNQYLGTGLGLGLNKYGNYLAMPIYASVKGYIYNKKVSPFYFGDIGYGYAWNTNKNDNVFELDKVQGGLYWQLGFGYQFNFYHSALTLSLGYINQHSKADYTYYRPWDIDDVQVTEKRVLRRVAFSIGFLF